ncbi:MAG: response regulator [Actinobacteria bacterium]|nr:MAG: response regulator [Actinomycetota bacterium]
MGDFLAAQVDYLLFLSGVGFLVAAMHANHLRRSGDDLLPWGYLAAFGLLWTFVDWSRAVGLVYLPPAIVSTATHLIAALAFLCLVEFWRESAERLGTWRQRPWILGPPAILVVIGLASGQIGIAVVVTYLLGIVASVFAAYALFVHAGRNEHVVGRPLLFAAAALALYAVLGMFSEAEVGIFPMSVLNEAAFRAIVGIPVQAVRAVTALVFAWQLGSYYQQRTAAVLDPESRTEFKRLRWVTTTVLIVALVAGWVITEQTGVTHRRQEYTDLQTQARLAAAALDVGAVDQLTGTKADVATENYRAVQRQMSRMLDAATTDTFMYLAAARGGNVVILVEGTPLRYDGVEDPPGTTYDDASPELRSASANPREFIEGPETDMYGTWYSGYAPVKTTGGRAVALLGIDRDAHVIDQAVAEGRMLGVFLSIVTSVLILGSYMVAQMTRSWAARVSTTERQFRAVFDNAPEGIFVMRLSDRTIVEANPHMSSWLRYPANAIIGMDVTQLVVEGLDGITACLGGLIGGAQSAMHECVYLRGDGSTVIVEVTAVPMMHHGEDSVLVFARDTTLRKQAEEATDYRARFYDLVSDISTGFINIEPDRVDEGVDRALKLVGSFVNADRAYVFEFSDGRDLMSNTHEWVPIAAMSRKSLFESAEVTRYPFIVETLARQDEVLIDDVEHDERLAEHERESLREAGVKSVVAVPMTWRGEMIGFLGFDSISRTSAWGSEAVNLLRMAAYAIVNALERKRTNIEVRRLTTALEQSPVGVAMTDADGDIVYVNQRFMQLTGYSLRELKGQNPRILKSGLTPDATYGALWGTITAGKEWHGEFVNLRKDGTTYWASASISPIKNYDGETTHYVCAQEDVTAIKAAEGALQSSMRAAEDANRAKSEFLASMSHEIRTPMNAIIGMAELLEETELSNQQRRYVDIFKSAGESLLVLINDVLDLSKIEAGKLEVESVPFDLADVVEKTVSVLGIRAREKDIELLSRIAPGTPTKIKGDPDRLRQVLTNLVGNAIKFTDVGQVLVTVENAGENDRVPDGFNLAISVADTGIGIPPEKQQAVFESFTQADSSTTRRFGGTGLGLTISRRLVELMGGRIGLTSIEGEGATFHFTIPVSRVDASLVPEGPELARLDGLRVLVVDDNATNRLIVREMLAGWGSLGGEAEDGPHGLDELTRAAKEGRAYDVVVLDNRMPGMDGMQLLSLVRQDPVLRDTGIVMLSSDVISLSGRLRALGVTDYLMKPVKRADLHEAIATAAAVHGAAVVAAATAAPAATAEPEPVTPEPEAPLADQVPLNVLLVEDSEDNRFLMLAHLSKTPHHVTVAENGAEAVAALESAAEPFDLILMDMQMPVMDGYEATRHIRELEQDSGAHTPIVALTAFALKEEVQKSLDAGCDDHLTKPIKKQVLLETLERYSMEVGEHGR